MRLKVMVQVKQIPWLMLEIKGVGIKTDVRIP